MTQSLRLLSIKSSQQSLPLFVFLPGLDGTGKLLKLQLDGLRSIFDIRCLSIPANDGSGWDALIEQTASLLAREKRLSPERPIYLCGESFGGCLALKLAAYFPNLCDRLILVNPASSARRQFWMGWGASITQWLPNPLYHFSALGLLPFLIAPTRVSYLGQKALLAAMQSVSPPSAALRLSLLSQFVVEELPLGRIEQPVLVLASGADRLLPSAQEAERLVSYLPHSRTVLLPNSGHACLLESEIRLSSILKSESFYEATRKTPQLASVPVSSQQVSTLA
jgi:pimeloyl-ACP methyl ester carboxylesterase